MTLHPQAFAHIEKVLASGQIPLTELSLEQIRQAYLDMRQLAGEPEEVARVEDLAIPGPGGNIPLRIFAGHTGDALAVLMYFHGGGFVKGDLDTHDAVCRALARGDEITGRGPRGASSSAVASAWRRPRSSRPGSRWPSKPDAALPCRTI